MCGIIPDTVVALAAGLLACALMVLWLAMHRHSSGRGDARLLCLVASVWACAVTCLLVSRQLRLVPKFVACLILLYCWLCGLPDPAALLFSCFAVSWLLLWQPRLSVASDADGAEVGWRSLLCSFAL